MDPLSENAIRSEERHWRAFIAVVGVIIRLSGQETIRESAGRFDREITDTPRSVVSNAISG